MSEENEWTLEVLSDGTKRWRDNNNGVRKQYIPDWNYTGYYDEEGSHHRLDGPARIWHFGVQEWWYHGTKLPCKSQQEFERYLKLKAFW